MNAALALLILQGPGFVSADVTIAQGSVALVGKAYAPCPIPRAPQPAIVILPGGGAEISSVEWAGEGLAKRGYVCVIVKPQFGGSATSYAQAAYASLDFLSGGANPYRSATDPRWIGAAGWSLGARALTLVQEQDARVKAIVAWDNLAGIESGDQGSPSGGFNPDPSTFRTPKVPAMGTASDATGYNTDPEIKKTAFNHWRAAGQPTMQLVFENSNHFWWSARSSARQRELSVHFTTLWFDRWLRKDRLATDRLLAPNVVGEPLSSLLSDAYTSAASFDGFYVADLRSR